MLAIDDPWPQQRFFFRSDNGSFVRKGVPILWFFNGGHQDVHRVTDSPEQINAEKAARVLRLIFYFGHEVANADQRPKWNEASYREAISQP